MSVLLVSDVQHCQWTVPYKKHGTFHKFVCHHCTEAMLPTLLYFIPVLESVLPKQAPGDKVFKWCLSDLNKAPTPLHCLWHYLSSVYLNIIFIHHPNPGTCAYRYVEWLLVLSNAEKWKLLFFFFSAFCDSSLRLKVLKGVKSVLPT